MDVREIARRAGVSAATVSRAVNGFPSVDPRLVKRVWKVIEELGYFPNRQAQSLATGRSRIFGLVVSEITNPFFPEIVQTFECLAAENNYEILLTSTVHDPKRIEPTLRRMLERRVDGIAILTFGMEEAFLGRLRCYRMPSVFVEVGPDVPGIVNIRIDYLNGIRQAVQHLAALRHQRIAFVSGPSGLQTAMARQDAFQTSMREIGLASDLIVNGDHGIEGGMQALLKLDKGIDRPTAVMCSNDMTAIGVMRQAYDQNIKIPEELSVVGFENIWLAEFAVPPLTTVEMSRTKLAKIAFQALMKQVHHDTVSNSSEYSLTTTLVLRRSTAFSRE